MTQITILRTAQKWSESEVPRNIGKHGRRERMFAKSQAKAGQAKKPTRNRVEQAVGLAEFFAEQAKRTAKIDITHHVNLNPGKRPITVRAKEKIKRSVREPIRLS